MVCSTVFAGVLVFIIEGNIHRFALMFELIATCLFALWLDYRLFIRVAMNNVLTMTLRLLKKIGLRCFAAPILLGIR